MNQVERIFASWSIVSSRSAPTRPNSPREIALSELARNPPSHSEIASKSKLRQTEIFFSIMVTPFPIQDTSGSRLVQGCLSRESIATFSSRSTRCSSVGWTQDEAEIGNCFDWH